MTTLAKDLKTGDTLKQHNCIYTITGLNGQTEKTIEFKVTQHAGVIKHKGCKPIKYGAEETIIYLRKETKIQTL
jgi:hypothetical protein